MIIETCAKVNLTLEIVGRRPDGFHELATVFQAIDLCDRIRIEPADRLTIEVRGAEVPLDERNLCHQAANLLARHCGTSPSVRIEIEKRIPVGAGLGGGSGNAAGTLGALARLWDVGVPDDELAALAADLGSDVAFFLRGGAAVGRGRGELLEALPSLTGTHLVVLAPAEAVATGQVYGALTGFRPDAGHATERLAAALAAGETPPAEWLVNDLELPATLVSEAVRVDREQLRELGDRFRLSGSGGAWFVPAGPEEAAAVRSALVEAWPGRAVWVTAPVDYGWRVIEE